MAQKIKSQDRQAICKLVIPIEVEFKIKKLLERIYDIEWSGVLFYTYEGNFKEGITITCKDILPMDKGNTTYTEFEVNEEVLPYMIDNDLLDCQQGLIHSHHKMDTFFSSVDINTLEERGDLHNNFVSLIVNNEGKYNAAITWKAKYIMQGSISLFGNEETLEDSEEMTELFYSFMTIEREFDSKDEFLNNRIKEISTIRPIASNVRNISESTVGFIKPVNDKVSEPMLPFDYPKEEDMFEYPHIEFDNNVVNEAAAQLMSLNLFAKHLPSKDKLDETVKGLQKRFDDRFLNNPEYQETFETYIDMVVENLTSKALPDEYQGNYYDAKDLFANEIAKLLAPIAEKLSYIKDMVTLIEQNYGIEQ